MPVAPAVLKTPRRLGGLRPVSLLLVLLLLALPASTASAQTAVKLSGEAFVDYSYTLAAPDGTDLEGDNGFTFRRLYLTSDFKLSDAFSARARLEASDSNVGGKGAEPFVKDLYLNWKIAPEHALTLGLTSTPNWNVSEKAWGYRSLEKTIMDFAKITSSRDMGLRADGSIIPGGALQYAVMFGNNNGTKPEDDRYKRLAAQLRAYPNEALTFTAGVDYADYPDPTDNGLTVNGFAGYQADAFRVGVEAFTHRISSQAAPDFERRGVSLFGVLQATDAFEVVTRYDRVWIDPDGSDEQVNLAILGLAYQPHPKVRLIPNLHAVWTDAEASTELNGRFTLEIDL